MKTRCGTDDAAARARAVMPNGAVFTARDRRGDLAAHRIIERRVPAGQSAEGPIIHEDYRAERPKGAERTPREPRRAGCGQEPFP